jgi:hypothetical protein
MAAWKACKRADWMLWILARHSGPDGGPVHRRLVQVECAIARTVLALRSMRVIETAEAWAQNPNSTTSNAVLFARDALWSAVLVWTADGATSSRYTAIVRRYFPKPPKFTRGKRVT